VGGEDVSDASPCLCRRSGGSNLAKDFLGHRREDEAEDLLIKSKPLLVQGVGLLGDSFSLLDVDLNRWSDGFAIDMALQTCAADRSKDLRPP
jgi:hypothetical protein